jgi:hypothetical protein
MIGYFKNFAIALDGAQRLITTAAARGVKRRLSILRWTVDPPPFGQRNYSIAKAVPGDSPGRDCEAYRIVSVLEPREE